MPVTVKSISLWRKEAENKTGLLAQTLEPLAKAGADLGVVMAYRLPGNEAKAAIEIYPVSAQDRTDDCGHWSRPELFCGPSHW